MKGPGPLRVFTSPACSRRLTRVEKSGFPAAISTIVPNGASVGASVGQGAKLHSGGTRLTKDPSGHSCTSSGQVGAAVGEGVAGTAVGEGVTGTGDGVGRGVSAVTGASGKKREGKMSFVRADNDHRTDTADKFGATRAS